MKIGFIGQGFIGKNYADDFTNRGFEVVRYSMEEPHIQNKELIADCDIVFIAVPTPTTPKGFDDSIIRNVIKLVGKDKIAVIKSTILPGTTESLQKENLDIFVLNSPEFLRETSAAHDAANPDRNIIGIPINNEIYREKANAVLSVLPKAPYVLICASKEAELIKYAGNCFLFTKVVYMNMLYDLSEKLGANFQIVSDAMSSDPRIGKSHMMPVHSSGRGAGGHCFPKDFSAFRSLYENLLADPKGREALKAMEEKNIDLLVSSGKDIDLLKGVFGDKIKG